MALYLRKGKFGRDHDYSCLEAAPSLNNDPSTTNNGDEIQKRY
jgi:hypothetical protein